MKKLFYAVVFLIVLTGCSNQAAEHSKAIEKLFTAEEKATTSTTRSSDSTASSSTQPSTSKPSSTAPSSSKRYTITSLSPSLREAYIRVLKERGIISNADGLPDSIIKDLYDAQNMNTIPSVDPKLWQAALSKHDFKDLEKQIKPQLEAAEKGQKNYKYKINVWLPNLAKIEAEDLAVEAESIDYDKLHSDNTYLTTYTAKLDQSIQKALLKQLKSDQKVPLKKFTLHVSVYDEDKKIKAKFTDTGFDPIKHTLAADNSTFTLNSKKTEPYQQIKLVNNLMTNLKRNIPYSVAPKITSIKQKNDSEYTVKLKMVEGLPDILKKLKDATNEDYKNSNPNGLITAPFDATLRNNLNQKLEKEKLVYAAEKEITVKPVGDSMSLPQTGAHEINTDTKKQIDQTISEIKTYVQDNIVKKAEERPASGVLVGANSGTQITIQTPTGATSDYYVKFNNTDNTDTILSAYIRGGESLAVNLPPGTYKLRFSRGSGDKWYGPVSGFGPTASSSEGRNPITVNSGGSYTLRLYSVTGGNLPIDRVNSGSF